MSSAERVLERLLSAADNDTNTNSILSGFIEEVSCRIAIIPARAISLFT